MPERYKAVRKEEQAGEKFPRRNRREAADQFRKFYGELTDEDLDLLEYEEEFDDFEPLPSKRKGKPRN